MIAAMNINKQTFLILFLITILSFTFSIFSAGTEKVSNLVAPGAVVKTVQSGFNGTEGPATDLDGNVYFTEKAGGSIQKWSWSDGKISAYRVISGGAIGMSFDAKGRLLVCEMENGKITIDDMKGNITVLADSCDGKKLHIPNDLWVDPKGGVYFSDFSFASMQMTGGGAPGNATPGGSAPGGAQDGGQAGGGVPGGGAAGGGMPPRATEKISPSDLGIDYISPDGKKVTR